MQFWEKKLSLIKEIPCITIRIDDTNGLNHLHFLLKRREFLTKPHVENVEKIEIFLHKYNPSTMIIYFPRKSGAFQKFYRIFKNISTKIKSFKLKVLNRWHLFKSKFFFIRAITSLQ